MSSDDGEWKDPVIEAYKAGIDMTLLIENLRRTPEERLLAAMAMQRFIEQMRRKRDLPDE